MALSPPRRQYVKLSLLQKALHMIGTAMLAVMSVGFILDVFSTLGLGINSSCENVVIDATGLGLIDRLGGRLPLGTCVVEADSPRELVFYASLAREKLVLITHYFQPGPSITGGLGVPGEVGPFLALKSPLFALLSTTGEAGGDKYIVLNPMFIQFMPLSEGVEVLLVTCNLPGLDRVVEAFSSKVLGLVAWTTPPDLDPNTAVKIASHALDFTTLKSYCENSSLLECS